MEEAKEGNIKVSQRYPLPLSWRWVRTIRDLHEAGKIDPLVSLKSIDELSARDDEALRFAQSLTKLPNYPVGTYNDLVGTWDSLAGTWDDPRRNEAIQKRIYDLAKPA